jgi:hypothetical protein
VVLREECRSLGSSVCMDGDGRHQSVPGVEVFVKFLFDDIVSAVESSYAGARS